MHTRGFGERGVTTVQYIQTHLGSLFTCCPNPFPASGVVLPPMLSGPVALIAPALPATSALPMPHTSSAIGSPS